MPHVYAHIVQTHIQCFLWLVWSFDSGFLYLFIFLLRNNVNILCWDRVGGGGGGSFQMMGETKFNSSRLGKLPVLSRILKMNLNKTKKKGGGVWGGFYEDEGKPLSAKWELVAFWDKSKGLLEQCSQTSACIRQPGGLLKTRITRP